MSLSSYVCNAGVILLGAEGDSLKAQRPEWGVDGSFLVFRQLKQLVPELEYYTAGKRVQDVKNGAELRSAQFFGRCKSGR